MSKTALLLLDLQNEMVDPKGKLGGALAGPAAERNVVANAATALEAARAKGMVVAFIRLAFRPDYKDCLSVAPRVQKLKSAGAAVLGTWGCEFPKAIDPRPDEPIFNKQCVNPFFNTGLMTWLLRQGVERLVLGGVATNLVAEATARAADDAGFAVTVLEDCCAAPSPAWHEFSVKNMLPLFGTVSTAAEFAASS